MTAPIEVVPNPHRNSRQYICCQCSKCEAIFLLARDENGYLPAFYRCPSCNYEMYVDHQTISRTQYKLLRAYYDLKAKLIKLTSRP